MTNQPSDAQNASRRTRIVLAAWGTFVSALAILNHVGLARFHEELRRTSEYQPELAVMNERLAALEQQREASEPVPTAVSPDDLSAMREHIETRLAALEAGTHDAVHRAELASLEQRITATEARIANLARAGARSVAPKKIDREEKELQELSFAVIGVEQRAGERFLAIRSANAWAHGLVRLLRIGEREGDWLLEAIEGRTARFRRGADTRQVAIP